MNIIYKKSVNVDCLKCMSSGELIQGVRKRNDKQICAVCILSRPKIYHNHLPIPTLKKNVRRA